MGYKGLKRKFTLFARCCDVLHGLEGLDAA
jgi:hypothetical protein